jgi:hypothetical protein
LSLSFPFLVSHILDLSSKPNQKTSAISIKYNATNAKTFPTEYIIANFEGLPVATLKMAPKDKI